MFWCRLDNYQLMWEAVLACSAPFSAIVSDQSVPSIIMSVPSLSAFQCYGEVCIHIFMILREGSLELSDPDSMYNLFITPCLVWPGQLSVQSLIPAVAPSTMFALCWPVLCPKNDPCDEISPKSFCSNKYMTWPKFRNFTSQKFCDVMFMYRTILYLFNEDCKFVLHTWINDH